MGGGLWRGVWCGVLWGGDFEVWRITGYVFTMIRSFRDETTALVFVGGVRRGMARVLALAAYRKLAARNAAERLNLVSSSG